MRYGIGGSYMTMCVGCTVTKKSPLKVVHMGDGSSHQACRVALHTIRRVTSWP